MASIGEYQALIAQAKTDIADYKTLKSAISGIVSSIEETSTHLKSIGNKLTTALVIDGAPVDANSFGEYASTLLGMVTELSDIAVSIPSEISELENKIAGWESQIQQLQIAAAKKREVEMNGVEI